MSFVHAPHEPGTPVLDVRGLCHRYNGVDALRQVAFRLKAGERVAVVGPNGAGKSTLFKIAAGLLAPASGEVLVYGHAPLSHICIAYLPQRSQVDWNFPVRVVDAVMMGRVGSLGLLRWAGRRDREFVRECLELVDMVPLADRQIGELSGGQQQRMFIARALAMKAALMLMDEPLAALDLQSQSAILDLIDRLASRGVTVMVALHDLSIASEHFNRVMLLNREIVAFGAPGDVFTDDNFLKAYGAGVRTVRTRTGRVVVSDACCEGERESRSAEAAE
jgi:manganese/iron transport system ATP-binding protein